MTRAVRLDRPSDYIIRALPLSYGTRFFGEPTTDVRVFVLSLKRTPENGYNTTQAIRLTTRPYNTDDKLA
jgi:hypothetical protein